MQEYYYNENDIKVKFLLVFKGTCYGPNLWREEGKENCTRILLYMCTFNVHFLEIIIY